LDSSNWEKKQWFPLSWALISESKKINKQWIASLLVQTRKKWGTRQWLKNNGSAQSKLKGRVSRKAGKNGVSSNVSSNQKIVEN